MNVIRLFSYLCIAMVLLACNSGLSEQEYVARAEAYVENGQFNEAIIDLKSAVQINGRNPASRLLLASAYFESGEYASAEKEVMRAMDLGASSDSSTPLLGKILLMRAKNDEVLAISVSGLELPEAVRDLTTTQGFAHLALGNIDEARLVFSGVLEAAPRYVYAMEGMARVAAVTGDPGRANELVEDILSIEPEYPAAWRLRAYLSQDEAEYQQAENAISKAIQYGHGAAGDYYQRALIRIQLKAFDGAQQDIKKLASIAGGSPSVRYAQGLWHFEQGEFARAEEEFEAVMGATDAIPQTRYYAGATQLQLGRTDIAENHLLAYVAKDPDFLPANTLLVEIKLASGDFSAAEQLLKEQGVAEDTASLTLSQLARAYAGQRRMPEAIAAVNRAIAQDEENSAYKVQRASYYVSTGKLEEASAELESVIAADPSNENAFNDLVLVYNYRGDNERAIHTALQGLESIPDSLLIRRTLASLYLAGEQADQAQDVYSDILAFAPGDIGASTAMAAFAVKAGQYDRAKEFYSQALAVHPGDLGTMLLLASVHALEKDSEGFRSVLEQAMDSNPESLEPRLLLARYYIDRNQAKRVPELLLPVKEKYALNPQLLDLLSKAYYELEDYESAGQYLEQMLDQMPGDARINYRLAKTYEALGESEKYHDALLATLKIAPEIIPARKDLATFLATRQPDAAAEQVAILQKQVTEDPDIPALEGKISETRGDLVSALANYQRAYELRQNNINLMRVSNIFWQQGNTQESIELLEKWIAEYPQDFLVSMELAGRFVQKGNSAPAIDIYRKVLEQYPDNVRVLNNLAWLLRESDSGNAMQYAEKAYALQPASAQVLDTYAMVILSVGDDLELARDIIAKAVARAPNDRGIRYHKAFIDSKTGHAKEAKAELELILKDGADFPEKASAIELMDTLGS